MFDYTKDVKLILFIYIVFMRLTIRLKFKVAT